MKKGFTLVELLGVLILLALILTLVFPSVLNLITNSRGEVKSLTNKLVENAANLYIDSNKDKFDEQNGNSYCVTLSELVSEGYIKSPIVFSDTDEDQTELKSVQINYNNEYTYEIKDNGECVEYHPYRDKSGANRPDLMNDTLTPVIYDGENWIIADTNEKWYDYTKQEWANAVILKSELRSTKKIGDIVTVPTENNDFNSSDVLAMFVWIPRYSYTISSSAKGEADSSGKYPNPGAIDIKFVGVDTNDSGTATYTDEKDKESSWYTHPAFTFGDKNLSGIWVGKFETSHTTYSSITTSNQLNCTNESCEGADNIRILPNVQSLRRQKVATYFYATRSISRSNNVFGINSSITDTHMMKNSEWGAVAYLSQSKYGKYGNNDYANGNKEVYKNDSSSYYTGRSSGKPGTEGSSSEGTCKYDEEKSTSEQSRTEGTGSCGGGASTTGNIYGIYDMSGGAYEYVMGNYSDTVGSSNFQSDFFSTENNKKYYDKYTITSTSSCTNGECKGHALSETEGWYADFASFVSSSYPWFLRGGYYVNAESAGVFYFSRDNGASYSGNSFRVVFAPTT